MKLNVEEILMVIIAFIIGWFLSNMMNRGFLVEGKEPTPTNEYGPYQWPVDMSNPLGIARR